jgi:hypothetical protein
MLRFLIILLRMLLGRTLNLVIHTVFGRGQRARQIKMALRLVRRLIRI